MNAPLNPEDLRAYQRLPSAYGFSTVLPDMDFETFSTAGYKWDGDALKWRSIATSPPHGLGAVGASAYTEHESTRVLSLAYDLKDGIGGRLWVPGMAPPEDLFNHILHGGLIEAWYSMFEYLVWKNVCVPKLDWPPLNLMQLRDAMAKSRAHALPGALEFAGKALSVPVQKDSAGTRLLNKFSKPRDPSKEDPRLWLLPEEDRIDGPRLYSYNLDDIKAEFGCSIVTPDLSEYELGLWLTDQIINERGAHVNRKAVEDCITVVEQAFHVYEGELSRLTTGQVTSASQFDELKKWLLARGIDTPSVDKDHVKELLTLPLAPDVKRVLEIRQILSASSVKKLFAIARRVSADGRLRGLFEYMGAERTGRWAGRGPQPHNLPGSGPDVRRCDPINGCGKHYHKKLDTCPWCGADSAFSEKADWGAPAMEDAFSIIARRQLHTVEQFFGDALETVSGCLRGLFTAAPGKILYCSDYSAIEAVGLAALAGEEWRLEVFRTHGKIYEMSASKITGVPFEEFLEHKRKTGDHHPLRKKIGKVAELASGYQGYVGAWKQFGADEHFENDEAIADAVKAWRKENPNIVRFWYRVEEAAIKATKSPGYAYEYRRLKFCVVKDVLYIRLLSGRLLAYHQPRVHPEIKYGKSREKLTFMGWHSGDKKNARGWLRRDTYGGKLTENIAQATCRDILAHAIMQLEAAGYPVVLHVHDEVVVEVKIGFGSIEEVERIMGMLPDWCRDWPIKAAGGWVGLMFRKD